MEILTYSIFTEVLVVLATVLAWYYWKFRSNVAKFWSSRNIPHLPPNFFFGNNLRKAFTENTGVVSMHDYQKHKHKKLLGYWVFSAPTLAVYDLDYIKNILIRDFQHFYDRFHFGIDDNSPLSGHLFNLTGHKWRNLRVKLTPTFTSGKMKMMYSTMQRCADELETFLEKPAREGKILEIKHILARLTTNIISSCAFGIETNALQEENCQFMHFGQRMLNPTLAEFSKTIVLFFFPTLGKLLQFTQTPPDITDFFVTQVKETIEHRKKNNINRSDFMQLLIQLIEKGKIEDVDGTSEKHLTATENSDEIDKDTKFSINDATAQAFVFFLAGFETSASTLAFCLYELGRNNHVQSKLKRELKHAIETHGELTYDVLSKLPYLDQTVKETLRKYPVVPILMREVTRDYYLPEFDSTIPEKTMVVIPIYAISRDPDIFPNPDAFDPERFSEEQIKSRHPMSYIPFGEGPRICIGSRFGLMQVKVGLAAVLKKYTVEVCNEKPIEYDARSFFLKSIEGINVKLQLD